MNYDELRCNQIFNVCKTENIMKVLIAMLLCFINYGIAKSQDSDV